MSRGVQGRVGGATPSRRHSGAADHPAVATPLCALDLRPDGRVFQPGGLRQSDAGHPGATH